MYFTSEPGASPRLPWYTTFLCLACVLILIINGTSLLENLQSLRGANALLAQTARVGDRLQYLNVLVMDAESNTRGYYISGDDVYLSPLRAAPEQIEAEFHELETLLADSPSQLKNLAQLRSMVNRKLSLINQGLAVYKEGGLAEIVKIAAASDARGAMDEIRLQIVIMVKEQNELLASRNTAFYQKYQKAVLIGVGINVIAILVLLMFYRLVRRSYFVRVAAEDALKHANDNLESMVTRRTEQLSVLSRHLIRVSEEEKARLARELHDEMGANLTAINMDIAAVTEQLKQARPDLVPQLQRARASLLQAVELKRRIVENLRPSLLDNLGLAAAIESYCDEYASMSGLVCVADIDGAVDDAAATHAIAVFRIVQESLNNIAKYARASQVIVRLARAREGLSLCVDDDGIGIDPEAMAKPKSHGLLGMRERALLLGGTLSISCSKDGKGTRVEAWIPLLQHGAPAPEVELSSEPRPATAGHIPSSPPCSTPPHTAPDLDDQVL